MLPIAPSTYYEQKAREKDPSRQPARAKRDVQLCGEIRRVRQENFDVYGVRKVWRQLRREGRDVARCTVARLMREMGLQGAVRGRRFKTTKPDSSGARPMDLVERDFNATRPNELWVSDLTFRGRDRPYGRPPAQIQASAANALGSYLRSWRAVAVRDTGAVFDARRLSSAIRGRWHRRIHGCPRRVSCSLSCEPCSLIPAGYLPYPLQRISQIRGPNVGALPWLFPRFVPV